MTAKTMEFDAAEFLDNDEVIAAYLQEALEDENPDLFLMAVTDVVQARSMTRVAEASGLSRGSLYKALRPGAAPCFVTVTKIMAALGVQLQTTPVKHPHAKPAVAADRNSDDLWSPDDCAIYLKVSRWTFVNRISKMPGFPRPHIEISRRMRRWKPDDVKDWSYRAKRKTQ